MKFTHLFALSSLLLPIFAAPEPPAEAIEAIEERAKFGGDTKYFHEPGGNDELGHYDIRYFKGTPVTYEERGDTLLHLIRSYLTVFREKNVETWIAHGTLLGWWWNGKIMPWDWDLDTQVSASTLTWLGENLNMTFHNYTSLNEDGTSDTREYLLDINPNHVERIRGDGQNVIDARWIDVSNGLFIDITGLSETNPSTQPGIWSCKNFHRYRTRDLYPLRETVFEGVPALVPYSFDRILTEEYSARALTKTMHEGHKWMPEQKEWVKQEPINSKQPPRARAHVPRSVQAEENPKSGLRNLLRVL
ncbi:Protein MNN4 [Lachnellula hyalina]|uniref:Protein MNN4 n=1 Tax=Lachnellula hyalina TaxID=1316788 RepID=A0A8H8QUF8_9HELO|nr:Protein MNN4 [Lachnellula hyalina]TVY22326.1 Protein MNN4 [Lachnellula hyalina]